MAWDVVVADYMMPRFDGLAALALARQHRPGLRVVLVSGDPIGRVEVLAREAGADAYVPKDDLPRLAAALTPGSGFDG